MAIGTPRSSHTELLGNITTKGCIVFSLGTRLSCFLVNFWQLTLPPSDFLTNLCDQFCYNFLIHFWRPNSNWLLWQRWFDFAKIFSYWKMFLGIQIWYWMWYFSGGSLFFINNLSNESSHDEQIPSYIIDDNAWSFLRSNLNRPLKTGNSPLNV